MTAKAYGLCIGLNRVDPAHYDGWNGQLAACEADAASMHALLTRKGFDVHCLLTQAATRATILGTVEALAMRAVTGDIVVITNSSHGSQLPDYSGEEDDDMDETTLAYDAEIIDDEWFNLFCGFAAGVRVLFISDSCHAGTISRLFDRDAGGQESRAMPTYIAQRVAHEHEEFYRDVKAAAVLGQGTLKAKVMQIGACQDSQTSADGLKNGLFTANLLAVYNSGKYSGSYASFIARIRSRMPAYQVPRLFYPGVRDASFEAQIPFTV